MLFIFPLSGVLLPKYFSCYIVVKYLLLQLSYFCPKFVSTCIIWFTMLLFQLCFCFKNAFFVSNLLHMFRIFHIFRCFMCFKSLLFMVKSVFFERYIFARYALCPTFLESRRASCQGLSPETPVYKKIRYYTSSVLSSAASH